MDAHRSGAPVLALASHIASRQIGTGLLPGDQPAGAVRAGQPLLRDRRTTPSQLPRLTRLAIQAAVGLGGAAVLVAAG